MNSGIHFGVYFNGSKFWIEVLMKSGIHFGVYFNAFFTLKFWIEVLMNSGIHFSVYFNGSSHKNFGLKF